MEQTPIYNAINFSFCGGYGYGSLVNVSAFNSVINGMLCPSDGEADRGGPPVMTMTTVTSWGNTTYPPNIMSYRGSIGTTTSIYGWNNGINGVGYACNPPDPLFIAGGQSPGCQPYSTGDVRYWICFGIQDVTDGTSNTIALRRVAGRRLGQ